MTLNEIMEAVNHGYGEDVIAGYWDFDNQMAFTNDKNGRVVIDAMDGRTDTLARFIVVEISETYDEDGTDVEQLDEAIRVMDKAVNQIHDASSRLAVKYPKAIDVL